VADKQYYMACLDLEGRTCLVVGAGSIGVEKARALLECGAQVTVVAPQASSDLHELPVRWRRKRYQESDLDGQFLVVAATPFTPLNRRIFADAEARSLLCNVVDVPELCSFIVPAVHRAGPIAIAVSTGGASPVLAQRLRDDFSTRVKDEHVELARRLRELRPWVKAHYPTYEQRRDFFRELVKDALG
jgi:precorrin-2 dehydrogenase/sirohydrochlorin ferrochelatase